MQTLISVFKDSSDVRRAVQRLLDAGFAQDDLHLQDSGEDAKLADPVLIVDARNDEEAEAAAVILHDSGAIDVDDKQDAPGESVHAGWLRNARDDGLPTDLADRAGQVSKRMSDRQDERAIASDLAITERDRPK